MLYRKPVAANISLTLNGSASAKENADALAVIGNVYGIPAGMQFFIGHFEIIGPGGIKQSSAPFKLGANVLFVHFRVQWWELRQFKHWSLLLMEFVVSNIAANISLTLDGSASAKEYADTLAVIGYVYGVAHLFQFFIGHFNIVRPGGVKQSLAPG